MIGQFSSNPRSVRSTFLGLEGANSLSDHEFEHLAWILNNLLGFRDVRSSAHGRITGVSPLCDVWYLPGMQKRTMYQMA